MNRPQHVGTISVVITGMLLFASVASPQTTAPRSPSETVPVGDDGGGEARSATPTFFGDTGFWFVPTAEVLSHGDWSASGYRRGTNYVQGFQNIGDLAGTFAVGIHDRAEVFGSFLFVTRVERDLRPLFDSTHAEVGGMSIGTRAASARGAATVSATCTSGER